MVNFYDILVAGGLFTSFITSILLFTKGQYQLHANRLLGVVMFSWGWYALIYMLVVTTWIIYIPGIFRIGSPLYYLIPVCSYLYTRSTLLDETSFRKYDWLHLIPALINVIDLIPFYLTDAETKRALIEAILKNFNVSFQKGAGFIPAFWHFQARWISGVIYLTFQWALLYRIIKRDQLKDFKGVINWLFTFTIFCSVIYIGLGTMSVLAWINLGSGKNVLSAGHSIPTLVQIAGFMALSMYLFFKPEVLYGIPREIKSSTPNLEEAPDPQETGEAIRIAPFSPDLMAGYIVQLEKYMLTAEPFKKQGFTVTELAIALNMPLHHLSYVLNHHFHLRFTDFVNQYRINYVKDRMNDENWRSYTLEALAVESGFSSRSTFSAAFRKFTGSSPSQYLQELEENNIGLQ